MEAASRSRLLRARFGRRLAGIGALIGLVGVLASVLADRGREPEDGAPAASPEARTRPTPTAARRERQAPVAEALPPLGPRRAVSVRVRGPRGPEAGVFVRAVRHDAKALAHHDCSDAVRSGADGLATVRVEDPAPEGAWLELARADATGLRHGFLPLAPLLASAPAGRPTDVALPAGGSLRVVLVGLPASARPRGITFTLDPPYGEWAQLFPELAVLPAADGGLVECNAVPRDYSVRLSDDGSALLAHVPADFALHVDVTEPPPEADAYLVESASSTGPLAEGMEADVLRVPEGATVVYTVRWRERPTARVRVVGADGAPVAAARVGFGVRRDDGAARLYDRAVSADADGVAVLSLCSGPRLPASPPKAVHLVVTAPGRLARVADVPGRWYGIDESVALGPPAEGAFTVEGTLDFPNGRRATGVPVRVSTAGSLNADGAMEPLRATTDPQGAFRVEVSENLRPVFERAGGFRVVLDDERLEAQPGDALWRGMWPGLSRARVEPGDTPLPAPRERVRVVARIVLPTP